QECDVRQRTRRHEGDGALALADPVGKEVHGMLCQWGALRRWEVGAVEPGLAVDVGGDERLADQRAVGSCSDRNVAAADEVEYADRVRGRLFERLVARDG